MNIGKCINSETSLSYEVTVFGWLTSCHKNAMVTCSMIDGNVHGPTCGSVMFTVEIISTFKGLEPHFK